VRSEVEKEKKNSWKKRGKEGRLEDERKNAKEKTRRGSKERRHKSSM
jgi:hypothetical protein